MWSFVCVLAIALCCSCVTSADRKNVLFLVADDMRPQLGIFEGADFPAPCGPKMKTPNLDALARRSLLLQRAYVQVNVHEFGAWICNCIHIQLGDGIAHPCFDVIITKPPLKVGYGWVTTLQSFHTDVIFCQDLNSVPNELSGYRTMPGKSSFHYNGVIMGAMASQITGVSIYSTDCSDADQRKHQSSASLAFVRGIHRWSVNSPHKEPVTRKMLPFDDVIMSLTEMVLTWW